MKSFTKSICQDISKEVMEAVVAIAKRHGYDAKEISGRFYDEEFDMKLQFFVANQLESSSVVVPEKQIHDYKLMCSMYGLKPNWLDQEFDHSGKTYRIVGLNTRKPKYCMVLLEVGTDKLVSSPRELVIDKMSK